MEPDTIDLGAREHFVGRTGDPLSHRLEGISFKRGAAGWNSQKAGLSGFAGARVFDAALAGNVDDLIAFELMAVVFILAAITQHFVFDPGKDACPIVVIVRGP